MAHALPFFPQHLLDVLPGDVWGPFLSLEDEPTSDGPWLLGELLFLSSPAGVVALRDAARDLGLPLAGSGVAPLVRAAEVLVRAAAEPAWEAAMQRVRATGSRLRPAHASYDLVLPGAVVVSEDAAERLRDALAEELAPLGLGEKLRVDVTRTHDGARVAFGHDGASASASLSGKTGRLHVLERPMLDPYLRALGTALCDAPIARAKRLTLSPIARRGADALAPVRVLSAELAEARAIGLEWDGDDDRGTLRGHDVLLSAARRGLRLENGALVEVVVRLVLRQGLPRGGDAEAAEASAPAIVDVWLREPDEVTLSDERYLPLVQRLLESWRLLPEDEPAPDLWSLEPWAHAKATWQAAFGETAKRWTASRILAPMRARAVGSRVAQAAGRAHVAMPLAKGTWWGTSEDPSVAAVTLSDADLAVQSLDTAKLGADWQHKLGLAGGAPTLDAHGVLDLGHRGERRGSVHVFLVAASPGTRARALALAERVRRASAPDVPVLLVPEGRSLETGLAEVRVRDWTGDGRAELREVLRHAGLLRDAALVDLAPASARLVVCRETRRVWLDGTLLPLATRHYALLLALAERAGESVPTTELGEKISRRQDADVTARQARQALGRLLKKTFGKNAVELVVAEGRKGYRLGTTAFVGAPEV